MRGDSASYNDKPGIYGENLVDIGYGYGVYGKSKWTGVYGEVRTEGSGFLGSIGVRGDAVNSNGKGSAKNYGVVGLTAGDSSINYCVYGSISTFFPGLTAYAGYFAGDLAYTGSLIPPSDIKLKKDISPLQSSLKKVLALQPQILSVQNRRV